MENRSIIDPTRKTVGAIYRDAQINGERGLITGDMNYEMRKSLVVDLNETVIQGAKDFEGRQFFITVYERRDLQMKNAFIRRLIKTKYRPYPEADTMVYKVNPSANEVYFCWDLPARYEMVNMLNTPELRPAQHEQEQLQMFRHWENDRLEYFGFAKDDMGNWKANPLFRGDVIVSKTNPEDISMSLHSNSQSKYVKLPTDTCEPSSSNE